MHDELLSLRDVQEIAKSLLDDSALGCLLTEETGLSLGMVRWCMRSSIEPWLGLRAAPVRRSSRSQHGLMVLSANVFTAGLRFIPLVLLAGHRLHVRISSRDASLTRRLVEKILEQHPNMRDRLSFDVSDGAVYEPPPHLFDTVVAFGRDETLERITHQYPATRLKTYGTGFGIGVIDSKEALTQGKEAALDIAAYDQQGCLSPQMYFVTRSMASRWVEQLKDGLDWIDDRLPRGVLSAATYTSMLQWNAVGAVTGQSFRGKSWNIVLRPSTQSDLSTAMFTFPGGRSVSVVAVNDARDIEALLKPYQRRVKCVSALPSSRWSSKLASLLPNARMTSFGNMQCPPIDNVWENNPFALSAAIMQES